LYPRITNATHSLLELFQWRGDPGLADMGREAPPFHTEIPAALSVYGIPSVVTVRCVQEQTKTAPVKSVVIITPEYFIVCDAANERVKRVTSTSLITGLFLQSVLEKKKKDRTLFLLVRFAGHVPERDFLCDVSKDPMNGPELNEDNGSLLRAITVLFPDVPLKTMSPEEDIRIFWEFSNRETPLASTITRIAESRAASAVNTYPMALATNQSQGDVHRPSIKPSQTLFTPPPFRPNVPTPPQIVAPVQTVQASTTTSPLPPPPKKVAVDRAVTALVVDTQERHYVSCGVGEDTVDAPQEQVIYKPEPVPEVMTPPDIRESQRETIGGTIWLSPDKKTYDEHQKVFQRPAVPSSVFLQGGGDYQADHGNRQFLRQQCRNLMVRLFQRQYPERLCEVDRLLDQFQGQEDKLSVILVNELQSIYLEDDIPRRLRENRVSFLSHVL
jgi:hypothetical protein